MPSRDTVVTFLAACGLTGHAQAPWLTAWERVSTAHLRRPAGAVRVREARPRLLGVHASIQVDPAASELPAFVPRDFDTDLRTAVNAAAEHAGSCSWWVDLPLARPGPCSKLSGLNSPSGGSSIPTLPTLTRFGPARTARNAFCRSRRSVVAPEVARPRRLRPAGVARARPGPGEVVARGVTRTTTQTVDTRRVAGWPRFDGSPARRVSAVADRASTTAGYRVSSV